MYYEYPGGTTRVLGYEDQEYTVHLPPVGFVRNVFTGQMEPRPILFEHKANEDQKVEQKRRSQLLPEEWKLWRKEEKERQKRTPEWVHPEAEIFRTQEWDRRLNGCWIAVWDPELKETEYVYLTGLHYFYVFHWKCDFGMPDFRFVDLEIFYMLDYCEEDPYSTGLVLATLRRLGKTSILGCWMYEYPSRNPNSYGGMQSKTREDVKKVFTQAIVYPWKNLVDFFQPIFDYNSTQTSDLSFQAPRPKGKSGLSFMEEDDFSLHSIINYRDASLYAYDGYKLHRYAAEEPGKVVDVNIYKRHQIVRPCTEVQGEIIGQMFYPTTVEDIEGKGADAFKDLFNRSKITEKNANGKTTTGLYSYFIPAYKGYKFDDYGRSREQLSKEELLNERKGREDDPEELSSFIRKYPFTIEEAFMAGKGVCVFNEAILNQRYAELDRLPEMQQPYTRGNLEWVDEIDGDVWFVPDALSGRFLFTYLPDKNTSNLVRQDSYGEYRPINDHRFAIATDPISHTKTVDPRSSKAAAHGFRKLDISVDFPDRPVDEWDSYMYIFEYLNRPPEIEDYFEDMIMACRFLGCQLLYESQKNNIGQYFRQRGYSKFLMYRPEATWTNQTGAQNTEGIPASREMIDLYVMKLRTFINRHGPRIPFKRTIAQLLRFDPKKTTEFDLAVSAGWTIVALEKILEENQPVFEAVDWFDQFDISGNQSKYLN